VTQTDPEPRRGLPARLGRGLRAVGRGLAVAAVWLWPGKRLVGFLLLTLLVVVLVFPLETRSHLLRIWRAIETPVPDGLILVDSPQIFTRERLVNDRFTEERWLANQLERTDELLEGRRFARPYMWVQEIVSRAVGGETAAEATAAMPEKEEERPAPIWEYEDAMAYRNRIRYAKIATQLDDAHDIDSNTLYRMNFSISVLPDRDLDSIAVVRIKVSESSQFMDLERFYAQLMSEYVEVLQETVNNVYNDRVTTIEQGQTFSPSENQDVDHFVRHQVEILVPRLTNAEELQSGSARILAAERFLNQALGRIFETRLEFNRRQNAYAAASLVGSLGPSLTPQEQEGIHNAFLGRCQSGAVLLNVSDVVPPEVRRRLFGPAGSTVNHPLRCQSLPRNWTLLSRFELVAALRAITAQLYGLKDYALPLDSAGNFQEGPPLYVSESAVDHPCRSNAEALRSGDLLAAITYVLYGIANEPEEANRAAGPPSIQPFRHPCPAFVQAVRTVRRDMVGGSGPGALPPVRLAVAEYVRRTMELMPSKRLHRPLRLRQFFAFDLASCSPQHCAVHVADKFGSNRLDPRRIDRVRPFLHKLYEELNCGARAQTYALTPKKDTSYLGLEQFSQATLALLSEAEGLVPMRVSKERQTSGTLPEPTILGIGDWGQAAVEGAGASPQDCLLSFDERYAHHFPGQARQAELADGGERPLPGDAGFIAEQRSNTPVSTRFGWLVLPRVDLASEDAEETQVADSVLVSALVSLPSWWGLVEIDIDTCWMDRSRVADILKPEDLCEPPTAGSGVRKQHHRLEVKLPGTADEVLSRMAFFPLKAPYLTEGLTQQNVVEVGRPAEVTLVGSRLWKNPRVRLGHQWADGVEVLPDMQGLIARFSCIEPDPGTPGVDVRPDTASGPIPGTNRPVRIWTSEGTTSTLSVVVRPFQQRGDASLPVDRPCWEKG